MPNNVVPPPVKNVVFDSGRVVIDINPAASFSANKMIASVSQHATLDPLFEKVYCSHKLNMRKRKAEIYQYTLNESNLLPHETLFLDDRAENLSAAEARGIRTQLVTPEYGIIDIFS